LRFDPLHPPGTGVPAWRVDLDTAPAEELQLLPGVGPRLAQRMVQDRQSRGAFGGVQGLDRVSGVGESVIQRVAPHVR
jgi:competence protein ComEA